MEPKLSFSRVSILAAYCQFPSVFPVRWSRPFFRSNPYVAACPKPAVSACNLEPAKVELLERAQMVLFWAIVKRIVEGAHLAPHDCEFLVVVHVQNRSHLL